MSNESTVSPEQQANFHAAILKALPRNISPNTAAEWERDPRRLTTTLRSALIPAQRTLPSRLKKFEAWKTIELRLYRSGLGYESALFDQKMVERDNQYRKSRVPADLPISPERRQIKLALVSVAELGYTEGSIYSEICEAAYEVGLMLCPAEVGPALRLQYLDQSNESMYVASEPVSVYPYEGIDQIFHVCQGWGFFSNPRLELRCSLIDRNIFTPEDQFVFAL